MIVPWFVTSELYSVGETWPKPGTLTPGKARCTRNTYAMKPPMMAMNMPVNRYCIAIILWSVDHRYF
jgi:hypothetical protein